MKGRRVIGMLARWGIGCLVLAGVCLPLHADPDEKIKVTVVVILASEGKNEVDHRLEKIAKEIQKKDASLKCFKLKCIQRRSLAVDEKGIFKLVDGKTAQVVVKKSADAKNRVELAVTAPEQGEIVYQTVCGKFLPIITRCCTKSRERLILAVRVQPCHDD
jgi:hypothetical protein